MHDNKRLDNSQGLGHKLATYVMQGPRQAMLAALACTFFPLLGWLALVIVSLVTLRKGAQQGFMVLLWAILPNVVLGIAVDRGILWDHVVFTYLATWLLALVLRQSESWSRVLEVAMGFGVAGVLIAHGYFGDLTQFWTHYLQQHYAQVKDLLPLDLKPGDIQFITSQLAIYLAGCYAFVILVGNLTCLGLARSLQARLYNPGAFSKEFYHLRLHRWMPLCLLLVPALYITQPALLFDLLPVLLLPFIAVGLSLVHRFANMSQSKKLWLAGFYGALLLFLPYVLILLAVFACADRVVNFSYRLS